MLSYIRQTTSDVFMSLHDRINSFYGNDDLYYEAGVKLANHDREERVMIGEYVVIDIDDVLEKERLDNEEYYRNKIEKIELYHINFFFEEHTWYQLPFTCCCFLLSLLFGWLGPDSEYDVLSNQSKIFFLLHHIDEFNLIPYGDIHDKICKCTYIPDLAYLMPEKEREGHLADEWKTRVKPMFVGEKGFDMKTISNTCIYRWLPIDYFSGQRCLVNETKVFLWEPLKKIVELITVSLKNNQGLRQNDFMTNILTDIGDRKLNPGEWVSDIEYSNHFVKQLNLEKRSERRDIYGFEYIIKIEYNTLRNFALPDEAKEDFDSHGSDDDNTEDNTYLSFSNLESEMKILFNLVSNSNTHSTYNGVFQNPYISLVCPENTTVTPYFKFNKRYDTLELSKSLRSIKHGKYANPESIIKECIDMSDYASISISGNGGEFMMYTTPVSVPVRDVNIYAKEPSELDSIHIHDNQKHGDKYLLNKLPTSLMHQKWKSFEDYYKRYCSTNPQIGVFYNKTKYDQALIMYKRFVETSIKIPYGIPRNFHDNVTGEHELNIFQRNLFEFNSSKTSNENTLLDMNEFVGNIKHVRPIYGIKDGIKVGQIERPYPFKVFSNINEYITVRDLVIKQIELPLPDKKGGVMFMRYVSVSSIMDIERLNTIIIESMKDTRDRSMLLKTIDNMMKKVISCMKRLEGPDDPRSKSLRYIFDGIEKCLFPIMFVISIELVIPMDSLP